MWECRTEVNKILPRHRVLLNSQNGGSHVVRYDSKYHPVAGQERAKVAKEVLTMCFHSSTSQLILSQFYH